MANTDNGGGPEWDDMIEAVMDALPVKLSNSEWRSVNERVHSIIKVYVGDIFARSSIGFNKGRDGKGEIRLWMSIGQDCVDFQKGFNPKNVMEDSFNVEGLRLIREAITTRIEEIEKDGVP